MKILHLLSGGGIGGIEMLCRDIADLSHEQNEFCFLYSGGAIADEIEENRVPVYRFYRESLPARIGRLLFLVKRKGYDIVIVHHEGLGIYLFYLILRYCFRKIRFIKYLHCSFEERYFYQGNVWKDRLDYFILKMVLYKSDSIIAVSEFVKKSYCTEFGCAEDKVNVIYNGIRLLHEPDRKPKEQIKSNIVTLLYIGRLIDEKGVYLLLEAVKKLTVLGKNIELEILGDGSERQKYENLSVKLGIKNKVHFEGFQLYKQLFYDKADIFVYPSVWKEAFGISIVEAMEQEMLCVASDIGGIPEIIEDGKDGFLFKSEDVDSLTEALLKAIRYIENCGHNEMRMLAGRKSKKYDVVKTIDDLESIFRLLVRNDGWKKN